MTEALQVGSEQMTETAQFLAELIPGYNKAEIALHNGDANLRIDAWSRTEPLALFGAAYNEREWAKIRGVFEKIGQDFSNCVSYENEIVAAEARGDLGYLVALEHITCSIKGRSPRSYVLRATTIFRRENGAWRAVHRHGDALTQDSEEVVRHLRPAKA